MIESLNAWSTQPMTNGDFLMIIGIATILRALIDWATGESQ